MNADEQTSIQKAFLKKLESVIPPNTSLAGELADILEISTDSAYRRMRGETALSLDEAALLCKHFNISLDSLNEQQTGIVTFRYNLLNNNKDGFKLYLQSLLYDLKMIRAAKHNCIVYACEDIPVFHNFNYPDMAAFKMFYWMKSILNVPDLQGEQFAVSKIPEEFYTIGKQIYENYANIPSIEIWTETTLQSTIKQIEFYFDAGVFKTDNDALTVCNSLRQELTEIQNQAEASHKFTENEKKMGEENKYTVYFSEIEITNNCVLVEMGDIKAVYLGHLTFNSMSTTNKVYTGITEEWQNSIIKKSTQISGISEKQRYQFFKKAFKQVDQLIQKIKDE